MTSGAPGVSFVFFLPSASGVFPRIIIDPTRFLGGWGGGVGGGGRWGGGVRGGWGGGRGVFLGAGLRKRKEMKVPVWPPAFMSLSGSLFMFA